jgi:hypothetical protein
MQGLYMYVLSSVHLVQTPSNDPTISISYNLHGYICSKPEVWELSSQDYRDEVNLLRRAMLTFSSERQQCQYHSKQHPCISHSLHFTTGRSIGKFVGRLVAADQT